ncbi:MAG: hypothetical protein IH600_06285 [Bacteroidetes bacterium]|nr:hypothetical protein [Bacteroidota bacterium]
MKRIRNTFAFAASLCCAAMLFAILPTPAKSQDLGGLIEQLGVKELARDYLRPGVDAVGYSINSGYSHTARVDSVFHIWLGAKVISTYIPEADRVFTAKLPSLLVSQGYPSEFQTATVVGGSGTTVVSDQSSNPPIEFPGGTGLNAFMMAMPQISVGPLLGTDLILRGLPPSRFDDKVGKFSFYGAGIKHELTHYLDVPFDLAVVGGYQVFAIGEVVDGTSLAGMLQASTMFGGLTLFGGIGYESYNIDISYTYVSTDPAIPDEPVTLNFERRNLRFSFGGALSLFSLIDLTAEYSFGIQDNLAIGFGLTL